jgi:addiction module HigA family antidote
MRTTSKSRMTIQDEREEKHPPAHPGATLAEYIITNGLTPYRVAVDVGVSPQTINDIVLEKRNVTAEVALRLSRYFGVSREFWMERQNRYDFETVLDAKGDEIDKVQRFDPKAPTKVQRPRTKQRERGNVARPRKRARRV